MQSLLLSRSRKWLQTSLGNNFSIYTGKRWDCIILNPPQLQDPQVVAVIDIVSFRVRLLQLKNKLVWGNWVSISFHKLRKIQVNTPLVVDLWLYKTYIPLLFVLIRSTFELGTIVRKGNFLLSFGLAIVSICLRIGFVVLFICSYVLLWQTS